jgi:hypothetical protein
MRRLARTLPTLVAAFLATASGSITAPPAAAATGATTRAMTSGGYHVELPGGAIPVDGQLAPPSDVMNDGTTSAGSTGGTQTAGGTIPCVGSMPFVSIPVGQGFAGSAQATADFGLLRAHADAGIENTPATIVCPDVTPLGNDAPGRTSTSATASFDDLVTVGSASGLPAGTMKHLRFTAVLGASVGGMGLFAGSDPTNATVIYSISASVLFGSPTVTMVRDANGVDTFPPSGESSGEVDVAVGTVFGYSGSLSAGARASAGGGFGVANATAEASNTAHAYIDSTDADVVLTSASLHDYRSGDVSSTTTSTLTAATPTSTTTTLPGASLHLVSGQRLVVKDSAVPKKRKAAFTSGDPAFSVAGLDPRTGGAEVRLFGPRTGASDVWTLPADGWTFKKGKYHYGDKAHAFGPVMSATLAAKRITLSAKGAAITYPLLGTGPQQAVALAIIFPAGTANPSDAVCTDFPGVRGGLKTDDPKKGVFKAAKAEAPGTCRALR